MKRSRSIRLVLLGTVGLVGLAGCDDTPVAGEGQFFRDPSECRKVLDAATCDSQFAAAQKEHVRTAPKFNTLQQCEAQFGASNCTAAPTPDGAQAGSTTPSQGQGQQTAQSGSGSFFMPLMLGYLGGQMMSRMGQPAQPVYRDAQNRAYSGGASGRSIGTWNPSGGSVATPASARSDAASSTRRSGFGSSATRMSSGSGS